MGGGDVVGTAIIALKANTTGFMSDITKAFSGIGKEANTMSGMMKGAGGVMTAGITAPIVAGAAFAVKSFETINNAEISLIRQTNSTGAAADNLRKSFTNVLGNVPQDAATVSSAMTVVSQKLNLTGPALESVTKQGLDMSRMLGIDAPGAVTGLTKAMNAFGIPANQAGNEMDKLYVIATKTGTPLNDLTGTLSKAGAVAQSAKIPVDSFSAAIGALAASGIPARQGNSLLTDGITKLQKELGKQDVGNEWNAMMERVATNTQTTADITLLGQKNFDKLHSSLGNTTKGYDALKIAQSGAAGSIEKQSDDTKTLSEKLDEFKNKAEVAFAPFGKVLISVLETALDAAKPILDILTQVMGVFSTMPAPVQLVVVGILGILAAIGPVLLIIGMMAPAIGIIGPLFGALIPIIGTLLVQLGLMDVAMSLMALPLLPIIAVVAAIGIGLLLLYMYFKPFHDAVDQVVGWVKTLVGDLMSGNFSKFGDDFKKGILGGLDALKKVDWGKIGNDLKNGIFTALAGFGTWLWGLLSPIPLELWNGYVSIWTKIGTWLWGLISPIPMELWNGFVGAIGGFGTWLWGILSGLPGQLWNGIVTTFSDFGTQLLSWASGFFTGLPGSIQSAISGLGDWLLTAAEGFFTGLPGRIMDALHNVSFDTHIPGVGVVTFQHGGYVPEDTLAMIHKGEYVVPASGVRGGLPAIGSFTSGTTNKATTTNEGHTFNITFNNAQLTSQQDADRLSRQLAFKTTEYNRRLGHARG